MSTPSADILVIRAALAGLDPASSARATSPLPVEELFTPPAHANALDPARPLVVGNRGVGKSVWSGVLADKKTRLAIAPSYPRLGLDQMTVRLGFHEDAGLVEGPAPSRQVLAQLLSNGVTAEAIWRAVLLRAVALEAGLQVPGEYLAETVTWSELNIEQSEALLRLADAYFLSRKLRFILLLDALDRMASTWAEIRPLTDGILRLTLAMQGYRAMRAKVFMRTDQEKDDTLFRFPDASKMRAAKVELAWDRTELYGLLFKRIRRDPMAGDAFARMVEVALGKSRDADDIQEPEQQTLVFSQLAGEYMGRDRRRGRTYTWVIDHLADAFGETTPRSFLVTLQRAANARTKPANTVIDHYGIREGVQAASQVRVEQLKEDYPWIPTVLEDLEGLEVPCTPSMFTRRWRDRATAKSIEKITAESQRAGPIELENRNTDREAALLDSLKNIGVIEERSEHRINMPDIFRVAAKIKRRGGVRPPGAGLRRA